MGEAVFHLCCLIRGQTMVEVMKIMVTSFKKSQVGIAAPSALTLHQAITDPRLHQRLLDTHGKVWVCLLWGHCPFLLGPGAYTVLFVYFQSLFPQSCVSSGGSMVRLMATSYKRAYARPRCAAPRASAPVAGHCWPIPSQEALRHSSGSVSVESLGPGAYKVGLSPMSISGR